MTAEPNSVAELERLAANAHDAVDLSRLLYRFVAAAMDPTGFYLGLYDQATSVIEIVRQVDRGVERPGGAFPLGGGFTSQVIGSRQPLLIENWSQTGPPVQVRYGTENRDMPESAVTVPIIGQVTDHVLGVLAVQSYQPHAYGQPQVELLSDMAVVAGRVIEGWRWRERAQADLQRRTTEMEAILEGMSEGMIITDRRGAVVRFNAVARNLLVGPDGWIVVGAPLDHLSGVRDAEVAATLGRLVEGLGQGRSADEEIDTAPTHEGRHTLSFSASPLRDGSGGIIIIRDVTELRALDRLRAHVLRVASHDLQNPLTAINGRGQLLLHTFAADTTPPMQEVKKSVSSMVQQTRRLSEMLRVLLELSQIAGDGRIDLKRRPTDVAAMIHEVVEGLQPVSPDHNFVIVAPDALVGDWDAPRLRQVLQNLVGNAVKYSPHGGRIEIHARMDERQLRVDVNDEGIGLSSDEIARAFDEYYRASRATTLEGSGLGLYICHAIISAHEGRIWATSPGPDRGSTFSFVIPA